VELQYTNSDASAKRPNGASCYPAAFAPLPADRTIFTVTLDNAPLKGNWMTFGLAKRGFPKTGSDGIARHANSWGLADERNPDTSPVAVYASGNEVTAGPRKLQANDTLTAEVDVKAGWCEVRLNKTEFTHRFTIPAGAKEDYWFGVTFANDHKVTIDASSADDALLAKALQQGRKQWRRSKFSLLGQGRAGKTAFANAVAGRSFEETASTVGIHQLTCSVKHMQASNGAGPEKEWGLSQKHTREYEAAVAEIIFAKKRHAEGQPAPESTGDNGGDIRSYMMSVIAAASKFGSPKLTRGKSAALPSVETVPVATAVPAALTAALDPVLTSVTAALAPVSAAIAQLTHAAVTAVAPPAKPDVDGEMVMKMLATMQDADTNLQISLFDFGGQSVFEVIHHLFLTRNGVYALVFNMEWLVREGPEKEKALRFMRNWLSSIAVHTYNKVTKMTAPIVIVGTRLDTVPSGAVHEKISTILHEQFSDNLAWRSVIGNEDGRDSNGKAFQWFFPVDNRLGKRGASMKHLMSVVHGVMDKAEYTHKEVPLTWFKAIDHLSDTKQDCLSLTEVIATAGNCGVAEQEVPLTLAFLHDMGHLMWLDEPGLRDVVILDPVSYLVTPATIIICKLKPDHDDTTHHCLDTHRECERMHKREWGLLKNDGVLSVKLLPILWQPYVAHTEVLLQLMVKFGLLVPLREAAGTVTQYLVPTLLSAAPQNDPSVVSWTDTVYCSCYFVFTLAEELGQSTTLTEADLKCAAFLPGGMFERIVGKALSWTQHTSRSSSINLQSVLLYKDVAVLSFGRQRFRLVHCADIHCVRLDVEGTNPLGVHQKLQDFIQSIADECMRSLKCFSAVSFCSTASAAENLSTQPAVGRALHPSELLIPLQQLRQASKGESMLAWRGGRALITMPEIKSKYKPWLQHYDLRERYDAFISYRWGRHDSKFTEQLFDALTNYSVGAQNRAIEVFLDRKRLQDGRMFKTDFASALTHSLVVIPVVSVDALHRMHEHDPAQIDNVLLEWTMILESFEAKRVQKVYPVLFGSRVIAPVQSGSGASETVKVKDFFAEQAGQYLPKTVPTATLHQARELLVANGVEPSEKLHDYTVYSIVNDLFQFLLCKASDFPHGQLVSTFAEKVVRLLSECGNVALDAVAEAEGKRSRPVTPVKAAPGVVARAPSFAATASAVAAFTTPAHAPAPRSPRVAHLSALQTGQGAASTTGMVAPGSPSPTTPSAVTLSMQTPTASSTRAGTFASVPATPVSTGTTPTHTTAASTTVPATPGTDATATPTRQLGNQKLRSLSVDELGQVLASLGFEKLVPVFAANKVSGRRLVHCDEYTDLMGEDFGVASRPLARELMELIEEWREQGVNMP
jgi:GTPase SAR1 family protein